MIHLWRAGPGDRIGQYVGNWPSVEAADRVIRETIAEPGKKVVYRNTDRGPQWIIKDPAPTLASLARSVVFMTTRTKDAPIMRDIKVQVKGKDLQPGDRMRAKHTDL